MIPASLGATPALLGALVTLAALAAPAPSAAAAPRPLSFAEARALADQRNGDLASAKAAVGVAQAGVDSAGQLANPSLSFGVGPDDPTFTAGFDVKLPLFGQRGAAIGSATAAFRTVEAGVEVQRAKLHAQVRRNYYALAAAQAQAAGAEELSKLAGQLSTLASERFKTGGAAQLEVEQSDLARQRAERERIDRQADAAATAAELAALLGEREAALEADGAPPIADLPPLEALLARVQAHPEVETLRRQQAASLARAQEERTSLRPLPTVSLLAERLSTGTQGFGLRAGLAFEVPILSWNGGKIREQEEGAHLAEVQARGAAQRLEGLVRAARTRGAAAVERAAFYRGPFIESAARVLEMAQAGYKIGRTSLVSVLQAQTELASARSRSIDAALEAQRALADLEEAIGADL